MSTRRHYVAATLLVIVVSVILYFVLVTIYELPMAASKQAEPIDFMFHVYFGLIAFFFSLIMVFMLYAAFVFRRRPNDEAPGKYVHGNTVLEVTWTVVPIIMVAGLGTWGASTLSSLTRSNAAEMAIKVTGQQWAWTFSYPEQGDIVSAELVLPVDQPIRLEMMSRDVLHSFWVPEFRVKQDLLPGRETTLRITPSVIGEYKVRCAEICGLSHSDMRAAVRVVSQSEFDAWVKERSAQPNLAELSPEERGAIWYGAENGFACVGCHSTNGNVGAGPTWLGLFGREEQMDDGSTVVVDEAYIRESILDPNAKIVSGFQANVMSAQNLATRIQEREAQILADEGLQLDIIDDLIAYIKTLK